MRTAKLSPSNPQSSKKQFKRFSFCGIKFDVACYAALDKWNTEFEMPEKRCDSEKKMSKQARGYIYTQKKGPLLEMVIYYLLVNETTAVVKTAYNENKE